MDILRNTGDSGNTGDSKKKKDLSKEQDIVFQCLEWSGTNELREIEGSKYKSYEYVIKLFGVTKEGYSVSVNNYNFRPYFFIKVPDNYNNIHKGKILKYLKSNLESKYAYAIVSLSYVKKREFYGFTNKKEFLFIKLVFKNSIAMDRTNKIIKEGIDLTIAGIKSSHNFTIYESNITPFLRFIHTKELEAAGWVQIPKNKYEVYEGLDKKSNCQIDISIDYNDIEFIEKNDLAPLLVASFDIECSSSHGDFPLATKNYKKLGAELYDDYIIQMKDREFSTLLPKDKIDHIKKQIDKAFTPSKKNNIDNISYMFTNDNETPEDYVVDKLGKIIFRMISTQETYKILAFDLVNNFYSSNFEKINIYNEKYLSTNNMINKYRQYKNNIKSIIEDCFSDEDKDKKNKFIKTIYTKTNKKPTKRQIETTTKKCLQQILLLFKKITKSLSEYELDPDMIYDFIQLYTKYEYKPFTEKIEKFTENYEIDEGDIKLIINDISVCINMLYSYFGEFPVIDDSRDTYCRRITNKLNTFLPHIEGDKVIQIGTTVRRYGETECCLKHIITLNSCSDIEGAVVESYDTEKDLLIAWTELIQKLDPDIVTGYNIFGFDFAFMYNRAKEIQELEQGELGEYEEGCLDKFVKLGRIRHEYNDKETNIRRNDIKKSYLKQKKLASSALGDNLLKYITMDGRIVMDLLKIVQKDFNLVSYKLDLVAENFINDKITGITETHLKVNGINTLQIGNFISINYGDNEKYKNKKFKIKNIDYSQNTIILYEPISGVIIKDKPRWTLAKDDVTPQDIFRLQEGSADDRRTVAVYCIQDCVLCNNLIDKLKIVTNNIGMSNVCYVPLSYLFLRGQGVKIFSLVSRQCRKEGYLVPVIKFDNEEMSYIDDETGYIFNKFEYGEDEENIGGASEDDGYEGAIVLDPKPDLYLDKSVAVLDYSSLYPSSMISENISHDSIVLDNREGNKYLGEKGIKELDKIGYGYEDITYDVFKWKNPKIKSQGKIKCGEKTCRYVQPLDDTKSIIPNILKHLLKSRKNTRKKIKFKTIITISDEDKDDYGDEDVDVEGDVDELELEQCYTGIVSSSKCDKYYIVDHPDKDSIMVDKSYIKEIRNTYDEFEISVLDGLQLAFKLTANSLYGQVGAKTSPIHMKDLAASTTATGRRLLYLAKEKVEGHFEGAEIIYGDTDSIFIYFNPRDELGNVLINKEGLKKTIELGIEAEKVIQPFLKKPHVLEYEKTFWPFILFSKKRYIGNKYEHDINKYKQTSMGIVLKRRDNAEIVKHVYGGVINILMNKKNLKLSITFLKEELCKLLDGKFPIDMLVITKSLRGYYKNPNQIAHKVLADRMGVRDPGNKPSSNDRIPYAYIEVKENKFTNILQGDRIEHIDYIKEHKLKPDYNFYITNQIMKPVTQIYALIVEKLEGFKYPSDYYSKQYKILCKTKEPEKARKKIEEMKTKEASGLIFGDITRVAQNRKNKATEITDFFTRK